MIGEEILRWAGLIRLQAEDEQCKNNGASNGPPTAPRGIDEFDLDIFLIKYYGCLNINNKSYGSLRMFFIRRPDI